MNFECKITQSFFALFREHGAEDDDVTLGILSDVTMCYSCVWRGRKGWVGVKRARARIFLD